MFYPTLASIYGYLFGSDKPSCTALDDGEVCGESTVGKGCVDGQQVHYCRDHAPSGAVPGLVRNTEVKFAQQDED